MPPESPRSAPYVAPGAAGGLGWRWFAALLWIALSAVCVHLMFSVAAQQEALAKSIDWWRKADQYLGAMQGVERVSADYASDPEELLAQFPPQVTHELRTNELLYAVTLPNPANIDAVRLWGESNAALGKALESLRDGSSTRTRALSGPAGEVAHHVGATMRLVTNDMADRLQRLDGSRSWLYATALFTVLAAGGLIVLNYRGYLKHRALAASTAALTVSETRYRNMFQENGTIQLVLQPGTEEILDANTAACDFYQLSLPELTTHRLSEFVERGSGTPAADTAPADDAQVMRHRLPSGELRAVEVRSSPFTVHGGRLLYVIIHDVTERHRAARALRESEARFRTLAENIPGVVYLARDDERLTFEYVNNRAERLTGHSEIEILSGEVCLGDWVAPESRGAVMREIRAALRGGRAFFVEHELVAADGRRLHVQQYGQSVEAPGGQGRFIEGTVFDVTERKRAREALQTEQVRLGVTLRSMADGVFSVDNDGKIVLMNDAALGITGWPIERAVGEPLTRVYDVRDERSGASQDSRIEALLWGESADPPGLLALHQRDGGTRFVTESSAPIRTPDGEILGSVFVVRDVTEQRKLEEQLLRAEKLDSLGVLAGGIAHDFNNILAGIIGNFSLARSHAGDPARREDRLTKAEAAAVRARNLTQQLLTLSKGGMPIRRTASLAELIQETSEFALRGSNVKSNVEIASDLHNVFVDRGQINQVLHNLVLNADQAMPEGGMLQVVAENVQVSADTGLPVAPGAYIRIRVKDTGSGIPPESLERVFDPYFTTKESGSGLGLASSYSIIRNHEGCLTVTSEVGVGTTFDIHLPAATDGDVDEDTAQVVAAPRTGAMVLLMDDDEVITDVTGAMLRGMGFEDITATTEMQAIEQYQAARQAGRPFDLVILDLTVPGAMGGRDAMARLQEIDPDVRAVVSSGYLNDAAMMTPAKFGFCGILPKPYTREELLALMGNVLPQSG